MFFLFLAALTVLLISCNAEGISLREQLLRVNADPSHLLSVYAATIGVTFVLLLVFGGRGIWWAMVDAVCIIGLLSLITCPIFWIASGQWKAALAIGASGLLSLAGSTFLYWRYRTMPDKTPPFSNRGNEDVRRSVRPEEEE